MRVIDIPPAPAGQLDPIPPEPADTESLAITWCREIATAVAAALDTEASDVGYRLSLYPNLPAPHTLHTAFTVTSTGTTQRVPHTVRIAVVWDNLWREPGFALAVDDQPVDLDATSPARAAVVLAHAAWQAVSDPDTVGVR
jgi:hypothetical protein